MRAVEIHCYGATEPILISISGADDAAESYFEHLRMKIIEAQRHSERRLWINPFDRRQEARAVDPREIQRVLLTERHATDEPLQPDGIPAD